MTLPIVNIKLPISVSGPNSPSSVNVNSLITKHEANSVWTMPLVWIW